MLVRAALLSSTSTTSTTTALHRRRGVSSREAGLRRPQPRGCVPPHRATPPLAALSTSSPSSSSSTSSSPPPGRKRVEAKDFRHPLDQQNTQILQAVPGLSNLTKALVTPVAEQMLILEQLSTSILVGEEIHTTLPREICRRARRVKVTTKHAVMLRNGLTIVERVVFVFVKVRGTIRERLSA